MTYLQPAIDAALPMLRAEAEAGMESRCTIRRETGNVIIDGENREVPEWLVIHTDLPLRIVAAPGPARSRTQTPGDVEIERAIPRDDFPVTAAKTLRANDHVEVTAGDNAGDVHRLITVPRVDRATACRCPVETVERPTEWGTP